MSVDSLVAAVTAPLNLAFLLTLSAVAVWGLMPGTGGHGMELRRARSAPGVLITIGMLGTFTGILVGLLGFDVTDLEGSVPQLLEGMTTAFISSVTGLALALVVRGVATYRYRGAGAATASTATLADLQGTLVRIDSRLETELAHLRGELVGVREAIGGQGESSLVGQIKLMNFDQQQAAKKMTQVLEDFAAKVSELGSKALTEALKGVIQDFNKNLTEQFGDNFKELNQAVAKLVIWQENYREHVEEMEIRIEAATASIQTVEKALLGVRDAVVPLPKVQLELTAALEKLQIQTDLLEARLEKFAELGEHAVEALPLIEDNITRLTKGFSETVADGLFTLQAAQREHEGSAKQLRVAFTELRSSAEDIVKANAEQFRALQKSHSDTMGNLETQLREMHAQSARKWQETLKEQVENQQDAIRQQLENLDRTMEQKLTEASSGLSAHLLGLHEKLVADYQPLLAAMRQVVEAGRRSTQP